MPPLAFLMNKTPICGDCGGTSLWEQLLFALLACAALSLVWFLAALAVKKKGQPLKLSPGFWYLAAPGALGAVLVLGGIVLAAGAQVFR